MQSKVQRWGNSLAVRIPKVFAVDVGLAEDAAVELSVRDGDLVISPVEALPLTLEGLLSKITDDNLHQEVESGPAVGNEVW